MNCLRCGTILGGGIPHYILHFFKAFWTGGASGYLCSKCADELSKWLENPNGRLQSKDPRA